LKTTLTVHEAPGLSTGGHEAMALNCLLGSSSETPIMNRSPSPSL
jgi:hypothetical protein